MKGAGAQSPGHPVEDLQFKSFDIDFGDPSRFRRQWKVLLGAPEVERKHFNFRQCALQLGVLTEGGMTRIGIAGMQREPVRCFTQSHVPDAHPIEVVSFFDRPDQIEGFGIGLKGVDAQRWKL